MEFGLQFFPDVSPSEKSGQAYWNDCLDLVGLCDELGFTQIRTVEHYFEPYGGYSPNPHIFLTAASQRTERARLLTGAVLPIFNHPLKIAGEIGMLDAISNGRLDCGFGRAFLPHEFHRLGRSMDESRARFEEGVEAIRRLLEEESVDFDGTFHKFSNVTSLPRPTQRPRPPFWVAALGTPESVVAAGAKGYHMMLVPFAGPKMKEVLGAYRAAWTKAGHPGSGKVALGFHMFCHESRDEAYRIARPNVRRYFDSLIHALELEAGWGQGTTSRDYPNYERHTQKLRETTFEQMIAERTMWAGTPDDIFEQIQGYCDEIGSFDYASMQVNFSMISVEQASRSMRLFAREVIPQFRKVADAAPA